MAVTAALIITPARYRLRDIGETQFDDTEMLGYVNHAVREVVHHIAANWPAYLLRTALGTSYTADLVASTASYAFPTDMALAIMVALDGKRAEPIGNERTLDSSAEGYFFRGVNIVLYPTPDENVTNGLRIDYIKHPTVLTVTSSNVDLADDYRDVYENLVVLFAKMRQEQPIGELAQLYKLAQDRLDAIVVQTNLSEDEAGVNVPTRLFA